MAGVDADHRLALERLERHLAHVDARHVGHQGGDGVAQRGLGKSHRSLCCQQYFAGTVVGREPELDFRAIAGIAPGAGEDKTRHAEIILYEHTVDLQH